MKWTDQHGDADQHHGRRPRTPRNPKNPRTRTAPDTGPDCLGPRSDRGAGSGTRCRGPGWRWPSSACRSPRRWCRARARSRVWSAASAAAIGYGLGVLGARVWREFADRPARPTRPRSWRVFLIAGPVLAAGLLPARAALAGPDPGADGRRAGGVRVEAVAAGGGGRWSSSVWSRRPGASGTFFWWVAGRLSRWMGPRAARALGWVLAAVLTVGLFSGVLVDGILARHRPDLRGAGHHHQRHRGTAHHAAAVGWPGFAGRLGHPGLPGPQLRRRRARPRPRSARSPARPRRNRSGPTPGSRRRRTSRTGPRWPSPTSNGPADSTGATCWSPAPPAPAGSTRPR